MNFEEMKTTTTPELEARRERAARLRKLPQYRVGRLDGRQGNSDWQRRYLSGDERAAYMLGRKESHRLNLVCSRDPLGHDVPVGEDSCPVCGAPLARSAL